MNKRFIIGLTLLSTITSSKCQTIDTAKAKIFETEAWKAYQGSYFKKSIRFFDSAIVYGSQWKSLYSIKAEAHWFIGAYAEAATAYKKMMLLSGDELLRVGAFVLLGMLYDQAGMTRQSNKQYKYAIKLWENGYVPLKQFKEVEEVEYLFALAFLGHQKKLKSKLDVYARRHPHQKQLQLISKSRRELLQLHFEEYQLPTNLKPLEE